jgi:DNA polymerase zeta
MVNSRIWTIPEIPPSRRKVVDELKRRNDLEKESIEMMKKPSLVDISQIRDPTQVNPFGQKYMRLKSDAAATTDNLVLLAIELHVNTRQLLTPDPKTDRVEAVVYTLRHFNHDLYKRNGRVFPEGHCGIILIDDSRVYSQIGIGGYAVKQVGNEGELFRALVDLVHTSDPDFLTGYEVNSASWGYIVQRVMNVDPRFDFLAQISRVKKSDAVTRFGKENRYGHEHDTSLITSGRVFCNIWRFVIGFLFQDHEEDS